jgi:uncharacterized protein (DUF1778 family)
MTPEEKKVIDEARELMNVASMAQFMRGLAIKEARKIIKQAAT